MWNNMRFNLIKFLLTTQRALCDFAQILGDYFKGCIFGSFRVTCNVC